MSFSLRVQQIDHVEMFVPDRYEAARWYSKHLGLEVMKDFESWAETPTGPLLISTDDGGTKLALFTGEPRNKRETVGFHRVAFLVNGDVFLDFINSLPQDAYIDNDGKLLTAGDIVDHKKSWSIYFNDPWGHRLEITTYEYQVVDDRLRDF